MKRSICGKKSLVVVVVDVDIVKSGQTKIFLLNKKNIPISSNAFEFSIFFFTIHCLIVVHVHG